MQLQPDTMAATLAEIDRRLNALEVASRVGLNRVRFAWSTHASGGPTVSTMDAWEQGPVAATWADDQGNTGTGYPQVTLLTGRKVLLLAQSAYLNVSTDAGYKASIFRFGPGLDAANPDAWPAAYPVMRGAASHGPTTEGTQRLSFVGGRADITAGTHTIKFWAQWVTGAGGATLPSLHDAFLAVIPID